MEATTLPTCKFEFDIPNGFRIAPPTQGDWEISYRTTGMWGIAVFFAFWLTGWTAGCVFFTWNAFFEKPSLQTDLLLFMIPFWLAEFGTIGFVIWYFGSTLTYAFDDDRLIVSRRIGNFYESTTTVQRSEINRVRQEKDGGEGDDSFPSWGLILEGPDLSKKILFRQPPDKSAWLGKLVADWAGVNFTCLKDAW